MSFGRSYEEFEVGAVYRHWPGKTVTEYDHHLFCLLTMTHHPKHLDAHYAQTSTNLKRNPVLTTYLYSLVLGMSVRDVTGQALSHDEELLEQIAPVFHGDTVYAQTEVLAKHVVPNRHGRGEVQVETRGFTQEDTLFLRVRRRIAVPRS
ncbi:MaoC like domain protein (plasmid) [Streptomyces sp. YIM 121038]|uniref:MaoC family dehydratase n=1 Tax=Streptomyces sp. YIM 121038 TaxID=2136401 RepID=UPI0011103285|nr:MaoC family dehydratase [Streptomyces sp. YIM 121038]QCX82924.1 MaoC like domain protein [Streptomyces sp. YIM 121038]